MDDAVEPQTLSAADRAELLERIERELKDGRLVAKLGRWANSSARRLRRIGIPCDAKDPKHEPGEELVQEAIVDTVTGARTWNGHYPLEAHLKMAIRSIVSTEIRDRKDLSQVPPDSELLWDDASQDEFRAADMVRNGPKLAERPSRALALAEAGRQLITAIRIHLRADRQAQRVADAWLAGDTVRANGIETSGLSDEMYDAAVKRILRMYKRLPDELRAGTHDALEMSHGAH